MNPLGIRPSALPRKCRDRRFPSGAAAVELAVLLPFLLLMLVIMVDAARMFYHSQVVSNCARNGALYQADPATQSESRYASLSAAALADAQSITPAPSVSSASTVDATGHSCVDVTVAYSFRTIVSYPGIPSPMTLSSTVRMEVLPTAPR